MSRILKDPLLAASVVSLWPMKVSHSSLMLLFQSEHVLLYPLKTIWSQYIPLSSFFSYIHPIKTMRIAPPTNRAVATIIIVALNVSYIPSSFISTANVAIHGKYRDKMVVATTSCFGSGSHSRNRRRCSLCGMSSMPRAPRGRSCPWSPTGWSRRSA